MNAVFWGRAQGAPPFDFEAFHEKLTAVIAELVAEGIAAGESPAGRPADVTLALMGVLSFNMDLDLAHPELGLGAGRPPPRRSISSSRASPPRDPPQEPVR